MAQHAHVSYIIYGLMFVVGFTLALVSGVSTHSKDKTLFVSVIERQRNVFVAPPVDGEEFAPLMSIQSGDPISIPPISPDLTPRDQSVKSGSSISPDRSHSRPGRSRVKGSLPAGALVVTSTHYADVPDNVAATAAATGGLLIMTARERSASSPPRGDESTDGEMKYNEGTVLEKALFDDTLPSTNSSGVVLGSQVNLTKVEMLMRKDTTNTTDPGQREWSIDDLIPVHVYKSFRALVTLVDGRDFDDNAAQAWLSVVAVAGEIPVRNVRLRYQRRNTWESSGPGKSVTNILTQIGMRTEQEAGEAISRVLNAAQHPSQFDQFFIHVLEA